MTALIPLHFHQATVRMVMHANEPWWMLNDVAALLAIRNPHDAASKLFDWQKDYVGISEAIGRQSQTIVINEAGVYALVLHSSKPIAEEFARWLFQDVLPSIRKHGSYPPPECTLAPPLDDEGPWDGQEKTIGERFREERERWELESGFKLAGTIPLMSKPVVRAIEDNLGGIRKGERIFYLLCAGIDVLYVMTGQRTLTAGERELRDAYRASDAEQRQQLIARAQMLKLADPR